MVIKSADHVFKDMGFGDMITARTMGEEYDDVRQLLNNIKDASDVAYLYAVYFEDIDDLGSLHYAINAKSEKELAAVDSPEYIYSYMGDVDYDNAFTEEV